MAKAIEKRRKIVEMSGGGCKKCGYKKCLRALSFHHRDPSKKEIGLSVTDMHNHSWEKVLKERKKCDLLCIRCHMEVEDELARVNEKNYKRLLG